jgi:hypothetical protein
MVLCQILYVSDKKFDKEKDDKDEVNKDQIDKDEVNKDDKEKIKKVDKYSAKELAEKLKQIGFDVGEVCEDVNFDETQKIIYEKMFLVPEVILFILVHSVQLQ